MDLRVSPAIRPVLSYFSAQRLARSTLLTNTRRNTKAAKGKRGPASTLERQIERISQLPRAKQKLVMEMLATVIQQAEHQETATVGSLDKQAASG